MIITVLFLLFTNLFAQTLSYETVQYLNDNNDVSTSWLSLNFLKKLELQRNITGLFDLDLSFKDAPIDSFNYNIPQSYLTFGATYKQEEILKVHLGKKLLNWYFAEPVWELGDLNNSSAETLFNSKQEGVIGVHLESDLGKVKVAFLLSLLHQPALNPSYSTQNGKLISSAHWDTNSYPTQINFNNTNYPINYNIMNTPISDIIFQKTLGLNLDYTLDQNAKVSTFFLVGPEHGLRKNINAYLSKSMDSVMVDIYPFVNQRLSYGLSYNDKIDDLNFDIGVKFTNSNYESDFFSANPNKDFAGKNYTMLPTFANSAFLNMAINKRRDLYNISLNYIQALHDEMAKLGIDQLDRWRKAIGLSGEYQISDRLLASLDIKQDIELKDTILNNSYNYKLARDVTVTLGLELIHSENEKSYWYNYRNNDTVYSLLTYDI